MTTSVASAVPPGLRDNRTTSSPHTPTRFTSIGSNFSSPGSTFRQEEDAIIIELGARYIKAGFEGESGPQCVIPFSKQSTRRLGDYRAYAPGYRPKTTSFREWAKDNELWRNDLGDVNLGLVEDKLERTVREVYNKYLLVNAGTARLVLVLPSLLAHLLLERVLTLLFDRWDYSTITLLPSPTMSAGSAGLRSALVVDVGWEGTVVTPLHEYRELRVARTSRSMKMLIEEATNALTDFARKDKVLREGLPLDHDFVEEVIMRIAQCRSESIMIPPEEQLSAQTEALSVSEAVQTPENSQSGNTIIVLDWPVGSSSKQAALPLSIVSKCVQTVFFDNESERNPLDDHEQTLPELIYRSLLALSPDIRGVCMSRIVFVGGGSQIPGLSMQALLQVQNLIDLYGWTSVRGKKFTEQRKKLGELSQGRAELHIARHNVLTPPEDRDYVETKLQKQWAKHARPQVTGTLREVESLGAWAGASLLTSLKVKGFVEIERDRFLSHGLAGANREAEISVVPQRMSSFGISGAKNNSQAGWSLGPWA